MLPSPFSYPGQQYFKGANHRFKFSEFSLVKWNASRVHSKRIPKFSKTLPGIFTVPFNFGPEISEFLVEWKAPQVTMSLLLVYLHFIKLVSLIPRDNLNLRGKREDFSNTQPAYSGAPKHPSWNWISPSSHCTPPGYPWKVCKWGHPTHPINYSLKISCPGKRFPCKLPPPLPSPAPRRGCLS